MSRTSLEKYYADSARQSILAGHSAYAEIEYIEQHRKICSNNNGYDNNLTDSLNGSGASGYNIKENPEVEMRGAYSPNHLADDSINPENGDAILYASEANKDKLAHKLGLTSKYVLENKPKVVHTMKPSVSFPRPRPG